MLDNDAEYVESLDMLAELRETRNVGDEHRDIATASLIEIWIDEGERRPWFLFESSRQGDATGHWQIVNPRIDLCAEIGNLLAAGWGREYGHALPRLGDGLR